MQFYSKLKQSVEKKNSLLCVGLDPVWEKIPAFLRQEKNPVLSFCLQIIAATEKRVAAYKPNFAFFEALGPRGMEILLQVIEAIPPDIVVIGDAKRGDIGNSNQMYAKAVFEVYGCDAVTANPYQGHDALAPFLDYEEKGTFVLCLTSNPGAHDFQIPKQLYLRVAESVKRWNTRKNCGLVVGSTHVDFIRTVRQTSGPMPFLLPGIGAQGGELEEAVCAAEDGTTFPFLISASRSILYADSGEDFAFGSEKAAEQLRNRINTIRSPLKI